MLPVRDLDERVTPPHLTLEASKLWRSIQNHAGLDRHHFMKLPPEGQHGRFANQSCVSVQSMISVVT